MGTVIFYSLDSSFFLIPKNILEYFLGWILVSWK